MPGRREFELPQESHRLRVAGAFPLIQLPGKPTSSLHKSPDKQKTLITSLTVRQQNQVLLPAHAPPPLRVLPLASTFRQGLPGDNARPDDDTGELVRSCGLRIPGG